MGPLVPVESGVAYEPDLTDAQWDFLMSYLFYYHIFVDIDLTAAGGLRASRLG